MAGQHGYQTKHLRLVAFLVLVCLAAGLVRRATLSPRSSSSSSSSPRSNWSTHRELVLGPDPPAPRLDRIHGRWEAVRASLGLPPPHAVVFAPGSNSALASRPDKRASRFDPGRKRWADEAARQLPRLRFASDTRATQPDETEMIAAAL